MGLQLGHDTGKKDGIIDADGRLQDKTYEGVKVIPNKRFRYLGIDIGSSYAETQENVIN